MTEEEHCTSVTQEVVMLMSVAVEEVLLTAESELLWSAVKAKE